MIVNEYDELLIFGTTGSSDFPTTSGAYSNSFQGGPSASFENGYIQLANGLDIFVCRLSSDGSQMLASTYLGGTGNDGFNGAIPVNYADEIRGAIWVDANNYVYVGTSTQSSDFPITNGAIQQQYGGGNQDGVVFKLNGNLTQLIWSTYLGGSEEDGIYYLVVDTDKRAVVTGGTRSNNFPVNNSTFGGDTDAFVSVIDSTGNTLVASRFIGAAGYDQSFIVGTDKTNHVYIFGQSDASGDVFNINTAIGVSGGNQFLMKLDPTLDSVIWSNAFGNATGAPDITPTALLVDLCDKIYCTGWGGSINTFGTGTAGLVTTPDAFQSTTDNNDFYLFVMDNQAQSLEYASFLGGSLSADHVDGGTSRFDRKGVIYQSICAGCGGQSDFPGLDSTSYSATNQSSNCNNLLVKFDFESPITVSAIASITEPIGCAPYTAQFSNTSVNADIFSWRLNDVEIGSSSDLTYTFNASGTYEVILIASSSLTCNGSDTVSLTITVISEIEGSLNPITVCQGQEATLGPDTFDDPYYQFQWSNPTTLSNGEVRKPTLIADSSTIYSVEIRVGTCIDTLTQEVIVLGASRNELALIDTCIFDTIAIGPIGDYVAGTTFEWSPALGLSSTSEQNPTAYLIGSQNYVVLINRPEGCTDTLDVPVNGHFDTMNAGDDVNVCQGEPASIGVQDNSGLYTYSWTPTAFLTNPNSAVPIVNVDENTQFNVIRTPLNGAPGCPAKDSIQVLIVNKPQALFGQVLYPDCQGMNVAFIDSSSDFTQLLWTFSNGEITQLENPITLFPFNDTLTAVLIVQNGSCRDTFSFSEYINDISAYYKENDANAFSPNGDGKNDCFSPAMQLAQSPQDIAFVPCSELKVFNRWGEIIFDSSLENNVCWDGKTSSGETLPEGVYFYQYRFGASDKAGFVHLKLN
jgi:gliding motility-associated-like protein